MMTFFKTPNINFVGFRRKMLISSAIIILAGAVSILVQRGLILSIDFAGGALVEVRSETPVPINDVREMVTQAGYQGAEIKSFGADNEYLIKVKSVADAESTARTIVAALQKGISGQNMELRRWETVSPSIGSELRRNALWAILYSFIGILIYVGWRFDFRFAVASIVATAHDVLLTIAFFSFVRMELSLGVLAALLTIVGYSLNDTVVVFDRIRENLGLRGKREDFEKLVNTSINETLSRTVVTGATTLLVLLSLLFLGGEVIKDFALTLFVGIIIGTYSSVFIAAPVVVEWNNRRPMKRK